MLLKLELLMVIELFVPFKLKIAAFETLGVEFILNQLKFEKFNF